MKFKVNPVYAKEMKLRVRSLKFAMTVLFFNTILVIIALIGFEIMFNIHINLYVDYTGASKVYFVMICLEMIMVVFLMPSFTAGSIAGEREKQTLDMLLTTTMKPRQIIIGKLMSCVSMVMLLVISGLPAVSIVFTVGGIGMKDMLKYMFAMVIIAIFIGSMGMFSSVIIKKTVPATVLAFAEVLFACGGTFIIIVVVNMIVSLDIVNNIEIKGSVADVSKIAYILLINPAFTIFNMVVGENDKSYMIEIIASKLGGSLPKYMTQHWYGISLITQSLCSVMFIEIAARLLDPLKSVGRFVARK